MLNAAASNRGRLLFEEIRQLKTRAIPESGSDHFMYNNNPFIAKDETHVSQLLSKQCQVTINAKNGAGNTHIRNIPVSENPGKKSTTLNEIQLGIKTRDLFHYIPPYSKKGGHSETLLNTCIVHSNSADLLLSNNASDRLSGDFDNKNQ